ncbi:MAG: hypothetical protein ACRDP7_40780 [Trebonia sp.]
MSSSGPAGSVAAGAIAVSPEELLDAADQLLTSPVPGLGSMWPRACALLIRLALELSLDRFWARALPSAAECGMRPQLLLLPLYAPGEATSLAREAWLGLAGAAHHHAYELAPTAAELRGWHTAVGRLGELLNASRVSS